MSKPDHHFPEQTILKEKEGRIIQNIIPEVKQSLNESRPVTNLKRRKSIQGFNSKQIIHGINSKVFNNIPNNRHEIIRKEMPTYSVSPTNINNCYWK